MKTKLLLLFVTLSFFVYQQWPDDKLHVVFCDVGQGDGALVFWRGFQMVIDGGPDESKMLSCVARHIPFWDHKIEVVVNSHNQKDHARGLVALKKRYEIEQSIGVEATNGDALVYKGLRFDILWPDRSSTQVLGVSSADNNIASVVGKLSFGQFSVLFTGDIDEQVEEELVGLGSIDVLKVAHHGSKGSTSDDFLKIIKPKDAVISVGKNTFGHPTKEAMGRLMAAGARLWRTDVNGDVEVITDGVDYAIRASRR